MNGLWDIVNITENLTADMQKLSEEIWQCAETYFEEYKSCEILKKYADLKGFEVLDNITDLPTAFVAKWGEAGPKIGFLLEYDALPSLSQKAGETFKKLDENMENGHGCGHNCLGAGAMAAAVAVKQYCIENDIKAQLYAFGCPAEENGSGKVFMAREGLFASLDACITWHPAHKNEVFGSSSLACLSAKFVFNGVSSHAASTPHLGKSALDGCEIMNIGINYLREHIIPQARVHYAYLDCGGKAPNVIADKASTYYFIRAPKVTQALEIAERVYDIAKGAALITGTTVDIEKLDGLSDYIPNKILGQTMADIYSQIGAPVWSDEDIDFAEKICSTISAEQLEQARENLGEKNGVDYSNKFLDDGVSSFEYQPKQCEFGSTDVGDVSYCVPTVQLYAATCAIGTPTHSWQMTSQSNSSVGLKGTITAAKVMAATALKLITSPQILEKARQEHEKNAPKGYICPTPMSVKPTIS